MYTDKDKALLTVYLTSLVLGATPERPTAGGPMRGAVTARYLQQNTHPASPRTTIALSIRSLNHLYLDRVCTRSICALHLYTVRLPTKPPNSYGTQQRELAITTPPMYIHPIIKPRKSDDQFHSLPSLFASSTDSPRGTLRAIGQESRHTSLVHELRNNPQDHTLLRVSATTNAYKARVLEIR